MNITGRRTTAIRVLTAHTRKPRTGRSACSSPPGLRTYQPRRIGDLKLFEPITLSRLSRYATAGALSVVLVAWLAVAQYLGAANAYFTSGENAVPTLLFSLLIPLMTAAVGLWLSGSIARLVSAIPLHWIVAAQVYRIGGGIFLLLWADGRLPWQFALPAGIGDVMTGCFAAVVAVLLAQKAPGALRATYGWCLFGIADLVVAVTMGAMTSPGRAHLLAFDAPNLLISSYPLVMVPTFAVPLALMLHGLVLWRLRRGSASTGQLAAA